MYINYITKKPKTEAVGRVQLAKEPNVCQSLRNEIQPRWDTEETNRMGKIENGLSAESPVCLPRSRILISTCEVKRKQKQATIYIR